MTIAFCFFFCISCPRLGDYKSICSFRLLLRESRLTITSPSTPNSEILLLGKCPASQKAKPCSVCLFLVSSFMHELQSFSLAPPPPPPMLDSVSSSLEIDISSADGHFVWQLLQCSGQNFWTFGSSYERRRSPKCFDIYAFTKSYLLWRFSGVLLHLN